MRKSGIGVAVATLLATLLLSPGAGEAARKKVQVKDFRAQASQVFTNAEEGPARGLVVNLSNGAWVVTDPGTGFAGPFGNIRGSGGGKVTLTNPGEPIPAGGRFTLTFRTLKKKLAVQQWWWLDEKGKRLGTKHKDGDAGPPPPPEPGSEPAGP